MNIILQSHCKANPKPSGVPLALTSTHSSVCNSGRDQSKMTCLLTISGIAEWTTSWLKKHTESKHQAVSQSAAGPPQWRCPLPLCRQNSLFWPFFLRGAVMPCCSAHIFSTQSPWSILTHLITIPISATPHSVYPHRLRFHFTSGFLRSCDVSHSLSRLVSSLIWQRVARPAAPLHRFQNSRVWKPSEGPGEDF